MQAFASTSKASLLAVLLALGLTIGALAPKAAAAADPTANGGPMQDENFSDSPFTQYGEFNEDTEEEAETRFLQYGRLFGVALGVGTEGATGNRGKLWSTGFPVIDVKLIYWFDFQLALGLNFYSSSHSYYAENSKRKNVDVSMNRLGGDLIYYFDTKDLSSTISFANPHVLFGVGSFSKTENYLGLGTADQETKFGVSLGAGLEFAIKPRKSYFNLQIRAHSVNFSDASVGIEEDGFSDLKGIFYTFTGSILFTW